MFEIVMTEKPSPEQFKLACIDDAIEVGSCVCTIYDNSLAKVMIIDNLKVDEDKRTGLGTLLLFKAFDLAKKKNVDCIELIMRASNYYIKKIYDVMGCEKVDKEYWRKILNVK